MITNNDFEGGLWGIALNWNDPMDDIQPTFILENNDIYNNTQDGIGLYMKNIKWAYIDDTDIDNFDTGMVLINSTIHENVNSTLSSLGGTDIELYNGSYVFMVNCNFDKADVYYDDFDGLSTVFDRDGRVVGSAFDFQEDLIVYDTETNTGDVHRAAESDVESLLAALVMGTRDYVSKCGFSGVVIGLSGGVDSALTACIAAQALGPEHVSTIFMPSRYTSRDNYEDTQLLAENLAVSYRVVPIDTIYDAFLASMPFAPG